MKIAFVSLMDGAPWGGSETLWYKTALYSLEQGDQVLVSVFAWSPVQKQIRELKERGATIHLRERFNHNAGFKEKLVRFVKKRTRPANFDYLPILNFNPEIVFISQGESFDLALHHRLLYEELQQKKIRFSLVCHSHLQYSVIPPKKVYPDAVEIFKSAETVFFVSQRQWKLTERRLITRLENSQITRNPLNVTFPSAPLPWPADQPIRFASIGAFSGYKGQDTALEVLSGPNWRDRNWKLNIYGSGYGEKYLKDLASFYSLNDRVVFHGHTDNVEEVWQQNHMLLISSAQEGWPITLAEAMVCGRPAVVTDVGGNSELISENETGFIACSPSVSSFADAMEKAWQQKSRWQEMGENCFNLANRELDKQPEVTLYNRLKSKAALSA